MNAATNFVKESWSELKQATWLTRQQAVDSSKAVIVLVALFAVYVAGIDYILSIFVRAVLGR